MTSMSTGQSEGPWSLSTRVIVYAAIGAAIYAVLNWVSFGIQVPWSQEVSLRPQYGVVTFVGFAFGPIAGFLTGYVGNTVGDQLAYQDAFGFWWWSFANGLAGFVAGLFPIVMASRMASTSNKAVTAAVAGVAATVIGFLFIFVEMFILPESTFDVMLNLNYIPVVIVNAIAAAVVTPILVLAWEPMREQLGR